MPELPEVETVVRGLRNLIVGWELSRVEVCQEKCLGGRKQALADLLQKKKILAVERRGKNVILRLSGGGAMFVHLGMSGRLRVLRAAIFRFRGIGD